MSEEWRRVPGFDGYEVSNLGNVRSLKRRAGGQALRPHTDKDGYKKVSLFDKRIHDRSPRDVATYLR